MNPWLLLVVLVLAAALVLVRWWRPPSARLNDFELRRRSKLGDAQALLASRRNDTAPVLEAVRRILSVGLLLGVFGVSVAALGIGLAVVVVVILALASGYAERPNRFARWSYAKAEPGLLAFAENRFVRRLPAAAHVARHADVASTEELMDVIAHATFLDLDERDSVRSAIEFPRLAVRDVMRPRTALATIDKGEVLGPLVIDDLYKTGETMFLVVDGDIDHVHGVLPLDKLTGLELRESPNALKAMDDTVAFLNEGSLVSEALRQLRQTNVTLIVIQDDAGKTVGAVTFTEIIGRLFKA